LQNQNTNHAKKAQFFCIEIAKYASNIMIFLHNLKLKRKIMDELELIRHRRETEHQSGDVRRACEKTDVSPTIFQSAMRKKLINDLTDKEIDVIRAFVEILDKRKANKELLKKEIS
jgi:hypothetical protein